MEKTVYFIHFFIGSQLLLWSFLFKLFHPQIAPNAIIGYRTRRSMKNPEAWYAANRYASNLFLSVSIVICIVQLITVFGLHLPLINTIYITVFAMTTGLISIIPLTELRLKKLYK